LFSTVIVIVLSELDFKDAPFFAIKTKLNLFNTNIELKVKSSGLIKLVNPREHSTGVSPNCHQHFLCFQTLILMMNEGKNTS